MLQQTSNSHNKPKRNENKNPRIPRKDSSNNPSPPPPSSSRNKSPKTIYWYESYNKQMDVVESVIPKKIISKTRLQNKNSHVSWVEHKVSLQYHENMTGTVERKTIMHQKGESMYSILTACKDKNIYWIKRCFSVDGRSKTEEEWNDLIQEGNYVTAVGLVPYYIDEEEGKVFMFFIHKVKFWKKGKSRFSFATVGGTSDHADLTLNQVLIRELREETGEEFCKNLEPLVNEESVVEWVFCHEAKQVIGLLPIEKEDCKKWVDAVEETITKFNEKKKATREMIETFEKFSIVKLEESKDVIQQDTRRFETFPEKQIIEKNNQVEEKKHENCGCSWADVDEIRRKKKQLFKDITGSIKEMEMVGVPSFLIQVADELATKIKR